jgi:hypothetical protein
MVCRRPWSSATKGYQPRGLVARLMSGHRRCGSSPTPPSESAIGASVPARRDLGPAVTPCWFRPTLNARKSSRPASNQPQMLAIPRRARALREGPSSNQASGPYVIVRPPCAARTIDLFAGPGSLVTAAQTPFASPCASCHRRRQSVRPNWPRSTATVVGSCFTGSALAAVAAIRRRTSSPSCVQRRRSERLSPRRVSCVSLIDD